MSTGRLYYLDNLRVFCMLFGVFFQAKRVGDFQVSPYMTEMSDYFRMATFFLISGFFMHMLLDRGERWPVVKRRVLILGIPLIFGLIFINPLTNSIASLFVPGAQALNPLEALFSSITGADKLPSPDAGLQHLWFLIILIAFVLLSPALKRISTGKFVQVLPDGAWFIPSLGVAIACFAVLARGLEEVLSRSLDQELGLLRVFLRYLPFFLLGMIGYASRHIWDKLHKISVPGLLLGAILVYASAALPALQDGAAGALSFVAARAVLTTAIVAALLAVFAVVLNIGSKATKFATDGVYTAYLLQIFLIWAVAAIAITLGLSGTALYLTTVIGTLIAGHGIWHLIVRRAAILRLLLSGKLMGREA